jgi:hypothetical protein
MVFKQMTGQSFRGRWGGSVRRVGQSLKPAMSVGAPELGMLAQAPEFWDLYHPIPCSIFMQFWYVDMESPWKTCLVLQGK